MLEREIRHSDVTRVHVLRLPDHRVAAFCASWLVCDELHVNTIAVHPNLRRRGLASLLMRHVFSLKYDARTLPRSGSTKPWDFAWLGFARSTTHNPRKTPSSSFAKDLSRAFILILEGEGVLWYRPPMNACS
jgi:GNAT superfamily N-acetyltransferase